MSYSLNSFRGCYIIQQCRLYREVLQGLLKRVLGVETIAHVLMLPLRFLHSSPSSPRQVAISAHPSSEILAQT